ncbi:MAG: HlyD family type I secretion periplasmic adaptor subunit [Rhodospirillaceae bacterium]|nr:HlyD family type I secretion periplasmic adaptor subunit [Rhodospirillaceae bacterium]
MMKLLSPERIKKSAADFRRRTIDSSQWLMSFSQGPQVLEDAIAFQDPIDEICAERPHPMMRGMHQVIAVMFLVTVLAMALVKVDKVVVGAGRLTTATPPVMLQPLDRGIIRELNVKQGDVVKKGQLLATLDPTFARADLASLSTQQRLLLAQIMRLQAEIDDKPFIAPAGATPEEQLQQTLFEQRAAQYDAQLRVYDEELNQRKANIRTTEIDKASQAQQLDLARQVETMRGSMLEKQIGSKLNFVEAQAARVRIEQAYKDADNRLVELQHDLQSKQAERLAFINDWRNRTLESLVTARNEAAKISDGISKASLVNDLVVITSPVDGVVLDVAKRSVGSVVAAGEPLITIVQSDAELVAEAMLNSSDIGYAHIGDDVVVKVDAFPYQIHGMMKGKLLSIGEESGDAGGPGSVLSKGTQDASGAFHRALVEITDSRLDNMPAGSKLIPGMTMSAEIKVGSRSVLGYFLNPITRGLSESIREP